MTLDIVMLAARLLLAAVFAAAGVAKLFDRAGTRRALQDFAVPRPLVEPGAVLLPLAECVIAIGLLPLATAWPAAVGALLLLAVFIAAIGISLAQGRKPDCHCFGQLHSAPAGAATLIRNAVLAAAAGFLVVNGRDSAGISLTGGFTNLSAAEQITLAGMAVLLCIGAVQAALLYQLTRQQGRLLLRLEAIGQPQPDAAAQHAPAAATAPAAGLAVGSKAPGFELESVHGGRQSLQSLLNAKPLLLLFTNPNCGPCNSLMPEVASWHADPDLPIDIALVSEGKLADNVAKIAGMRMPALLQKKREVAVAYEAYGTPAAVVIFPDGTIGSALAMGADGVRALLLEAIDMHGAAQSAPAATELRRPRPVANGNGDTSKLTLRNAAGETVALTALGKPALLLFWNPNCGFCAQMLADLQRWDAAPPPNAPAFVIVSTGTPEQNAAMKLRAPIMSDPDSSVRNAFNAHGTPMAVLLDESGRMLEDVAAGAQAVFALAGANLAEAA